MQFIVSQIKSDIQICDSDAIDNFKKKYNLNNCKVSIYKKSIDARKKSDIKFVYSFLVESNQKKLPNIKNVTEYKKEDLKIEFGNTPLNSRPVIAGSGPAGLFCAYFMAKYGYAPIVLERGEKIEDRTKTVDLFSKTGKLNENSNVQFGEGGAGAFSDGKLTTRISDPLCKDIIEVLAECSGIDELNYTAHPHIGTDKLKECVINLRNEIIRLGGEFRFCDKLLDFKVNNKKLVSVTTEISGEIPCEILVIATGHSATDIYELMKKKNITMEQKSFSVGVRVEHLRRDIDRIQYGKFAHLLPASEYRLFHHLSNGHTAYSFCMCPGGTVVASQSEENTIVVNGMSEFKRDGINSNSAICISVSPTDFGTDIFDGLNFIKNIEKKAYKLGGSNYNAPFMLLSDFLNTECTSETPSPTYSLGVKETDLSDLFPDFVTNGLKEGFTGFEKYMPGFTKCGAVLTAPETRTSSPLRIKRNETRQSPDVFGLYPTGEGAGYAGGIVSAATDGAKTALAIIKQYKTI